MTTAIDASVLWAIVKEEPGHERWADALMEASSEGSLIISPVAFAELSPSARSETELSEFLSELGIVYSDILPAAAHLAGVTFKLYRKAGGPRQHLVPDFLIAAHARIQADRLAAIDRGFLRRWFPDLELLRLS